jgi:pimeloyl-ACP methyl ester carboxylesterase
MGIFAFVATALACLVALVVLSYAVEALRPPPSPPGRLSWDPTIPIKYVDLGGTRVRYIKTGSGPNLVLLHTLRTQLDIFHKIIPELAVHFTIYAYDYPGHGWSDIAPADYAPEDFYQWTAAFLKALDIDQTCLAGISIGGTIALVLAARHDPRIRGVIAINPYDYPPAGGVRKSSLMARLILEPAGVPILGATLMRLRTRFVSDRIMLGGVASAEALSRQLRKELYDVGARRGHYQAFLSLLRHERLWSQARNEYPRVQVPTLLIYGDQDWAPDAVREQNHALIPNVTMITVSRGGHFLSLDRAAELVDPILRFAASAAGARNAQSSAR